jgi:hypothetical protein
MCNRCWCIVAVLAMCGSMSAAFATPQQQSPQTQSHVKPSKATDKREDGKKEKAPGAQSKAEEKELLFQSLLAKVWHAVFQIEPVEYSILVQVEAATLLWEHQRERAAIEIEKASGRLRELMGKKDSNITLTPAERAEKRRFRMMILRKLARLNPDLIKGLMDDKTIDPSSRATDEGTAIMAIAIDEIKRDPKQAVQLAHRSLSFGVTGGLAIFLDVLSRHNQQLADEQVMVFLAKLRAIPRSSWTMQSLRRFVPASKLDYYFESLAISFRPYLQPHVGPGEYERILREIQRAIQSAASYPRWKQEFTTLASGIEKVMASSALPIPDTDTKTLKIGMDTMAAAAAGETQGIAIDASRADTLTNASARDEAYQRLAVEAAEHADADLAEKLLSKIINVEMRRKTSMRVYSPLVRKALDENDWQEAKTLTLKIADPLGRSLIADRLMKAMLNGGQSKESVRAVYSGILASLDQEPATPDVARGLIHLARSLVAIHLEDGFAATGLTVSVLNKMDSSRSISLQPATMKGLNTWVAQTNPMLDIEDYFDLTETIGPLFQELSKHDADRAQTMVSGISHLGLISLAQLGIAKEMLKEIKDAKRVGK